MVEENDKDKEKNLKIEENKDKLPTKEIQLSSQQISHQQQ